MVKDNLNEDLQRLISGNKTSNPEIAFSNYPEIEKLDDVVKRHRRWLKDYHGLYYSIGSNGKDLVKWRKERRKYIYSHENFSVDINKIQRHKSRVVIEFDSDNAKEYLEKVKALLKEKGWGYIQSSHKGKSDYLWVEFTREVKDEEAKSFLQWIAPEGSEIDLNFANSNFRLPVLYAVHWKHSYERELPIEYFQGSKIDYDSLNIGEVAGKKKVVKGYATYQKFGEIPKLSFPKVTLEVFKQKLHDWFYFKDNEVIDIILATLLGEKIEGEPVWLFIIAPSGALKTETLRCFSLNEDFFPLSDLTSKTFVSGLMIGKGDKREKIEDLLPQLNGKVIIFKDFTTILEKGREERAEIFAQLREIYDGSFAKKFGTIDKTIRYNSRFGLIAGVTPIIDKFWKMTQQLGERFIKVRWEEDIDEVTRKSRENEGKEKEMREELNRYAMGFITNLDLSKTPDFDDNKFGNLIDSYAKFVAIARTPITIQDNRTDFYFDYIPKPERPTRLVKQFKKLCRLLALIREKKEADIEELNTIKRVAKDTIPQDRLAILDTINKNNNSTYGCSKGIIYDKVNLPRSSIDRILLQLKMLNLIKEVVIKEDYGAYTEQSSIYQINEMVKGVL